MRPISSRNNDYRLGQLSLFPEKLDNDITMRLASNDARSHLSSGLSDNGDTINVTDGSPFPDHGIVLVNAEMMYFEHKDGNRLYGLTRGWSGTRTQRHNKGDTVSAVIDADHHNSIRDALLKLQSKIGVVSDDEEEPSITGRLSLAKRKWTNPEANFRASNRKGYAPLVVSFQDLSRGFPTVTRWNFGDGAGASGTSNPSHVYTTPGKYDVTLEIVNQTAGYSSRRKKEYVEVLTSADILRVTFCVRYPEVVSRFRASNSISGFSVDSEIKAVLSQILSIPSAETQRQIAYLLGFGEITLSALTQALTNYGPQALLDAVAFTENAELIARVSDLSIYVSGEREAETDEDRQEFNVESQTLVPIDPVTGNRTVFVGQEVEFFDQSGGRISKREWDFGDGRSASTDGNGWKVRHTYDEAGIFVPSLTVTGTTGQVTNANMNSRIEVVSA